MRAGNVRQGFPNTPMKMEDDYLLGPVRSSCCSNCSAGRVVVGGTALCTIPILGIATIIFKTLACPCVLITYMSAMDDKNHFNIPSSEQESTDDCVRCLCAPATKTGDLIPKIWNYTFYGKTE